MSIYNKLNEARIKLQNSEIKKTGENKYAGFKYYELNDFLPTLNEINNELGILTIFNIENDIATLKIVDHEKEIVFSLPVAEAGMKGMQPIQKLGSQITYMRRYLLMCAYEITEFDTVDALPQTKQSKSSGPPKSDKPNKIKTQELIDIGKSKGISEQKILDLYEKEHKKVSEVKFIPQAIKQEYYERMDKIKKGDK